MIPERYNRPPVKPFVAVQNNTGRMVSASALTESQRQQVWRGIKRTRPGLAKMLAEDENLKQLKENFQTRIQFPIEELNEYMQAGEIK